MKRWIPLALLAVFLGLEFLFRWTWPFGWTLRPPATYIGLLPILLGLFLGFLGLHHLKKGRTTVKAFHVPRRLVTTGIYRYTRNPIYLGLALLLVGTCILLGARCVLLPMAIFVIVADCWIVRGEERMLLRKFGREFEEYRARTRRWI
jgi:protein-S-isoprenylcysteine O-methyltransferase Ste14